MNSKTKNGLAWAVTLLCPLLVLLLPQQEAFTWKIQEYLAVTLLAILCFAFGKVNQTLVSVLLPVCYIVLKIANPAQALAPYTQSTIWMLFGGFIMADILTDTGLLKRMALKCILLTGGSYKGLHWGLAFAGLVLSIIIPGKVPIFLAALTFGIIKAMSYSGKEASGLMITAAVAAIVPNTSFIYNPNFFVMVTAGMKATGPLPLTWMGYFLNNAVCLLWYIFIIWLSIRMFASKAAINAKAYIAGEYAKLGALTVNEKKGLFFVFLLLIALLTPQYHGVAAPWCFVLVPALMLLPGVGLTDPNKIMKNANYSFLFFVGGCMSIGTVAGAIGLGKIIQTLAMPILAGKSSLFVLIFAWVLCVLLNFLMTPMAIYSSLSLPLANIALAQGINPLAMYFTMYHATDQILLAYEYALYMIFFGYSVIATKDFVKYFALKMVFNLIFVVAILVPFWNFIGFLH